MFGSAHLLQDLQKAGWLWMFCDIFVMFSTNIDCKNLPVFQVSKLLQLPSADLWLALHHG